MDRFCEPVTDSFADHDSIHDGLDAAWLLTLRLRRVVYVDHLAIDASTDKARLADGGQNVAVFPLAAAHHRRQDHHPSAVRQREQILDDLLGSLLADRLPATVAACLAQGAKSRRR